MKKLFLAVAAIIAMFTVVPAHGLSFAFSFSDDPSETQMTSLYGRNHLSGTVTGLIAGLQNGIADQLPVQIQITSDESARGLVGSTFTPLLMLGTGFEVTGNQIVAANLLFNFLDNTGQEFQLRFNYADAARPSYNWLLANGGLAPNFGDGQR